MKIGKGIAKGQWCSGVMEKVNLEKNPNF